MCGMHPTSSPDASSLGAPAIDSASRAERIEARLRALLAPTRLDVIDDSARHAGHSGARAEGQTHYSVLVVAEAFRGETRVARSRTVHAALAEEFATGLHALALTLRTPEEQQPKEQQPKEQQPKEQQPEEQQPEEHSGLDTRT
jgi:stress-induced morphogen